MSFTALSCKKEEPLQNWWVNFKATPVIDCNCALKWKDGDNNESVSSGNISGSEGYNKYIKEKTKIDYFCSNNSSQPTKDSIQLIVKNKDKGTIYLSKWFKFTESTRNQSGSLTVD